MVDVLRIVQLWLLGESSVTDLLGTNPAGSIYGGSDLPEKFDPELGPAVQVTLAGGTVHAEIIGETMSRVQVKAWANVNEYKLAHELFRAVYAVMHGANMVDFGDDGRILSCQATTPGQDVTDPDVSWVSVLGFFEVDAIQTSPASLTDFVSSTQTVKDYVDQQIDLEDAVENGGSL